MIANTNPTTGIRYGVISGSSLYPELLSDLMYTHGTDIDYVEAEKAKREELDQEVIDDEVDEDDREDEVDSRLEKWADNWDSSESTYEGEHEGVKYRISSLGGAPLVWACEGLVGYAKRLCSPCVPNAADLDGGFLSEEDVNDLDTLDEKVKKLFDGAGRYPDDVFECYVFPKSWIIDLDNPNGG